jgi:AraC-like DNA-binding protein
VLKLLRHKKNVRNYFSNLKKKELRWLFYISSGYLIYLIIAIGLFLINQYFDYRTPVIDIDVSIIPLSIYVFGLGVYGYKQESIFNEDFSNQLRKGDKDVKYFRSGLNQSESIEIIYKIKTIMKEEKPYLNSDFNIRDLAKLANTTIHKLSQVINESFQKNFYELVNEYRIREVEGMLKDPAYNNLKIISIAYDCGFNSKSAFYIAFRQYTGITPTEYRKKLQLNNQQVSLN